MKKKLGAIITRIVFLGLSAFVLVMWLNSFLDLDGDHRGTPNELKITQQEALASTNDFEGALADSILPLDTMYIEDVSAAPGDSFWVTLSITNTIPIAGWQAMFKYPKAYIYPEVEMDIDTSLEGLVDTTLRIVVDSTSRTNYPLYWFFFNASPRYKHLDTCKATALIYLDPYGGPSSPPLPAYHGPVMRFKFWVADSAEAGDQYDIEFVPWEVLPNQQAFPANYFTDELGETDMLPQCWPGKFTVEEGGVPGNNDPEFLEPTQLTFEVYEGTKLEFSVTARDEDGDTITLSMDPLDLAGLNYKFEQIKGVGLVTQKFDYTPGFDEAPVTRSAKFIARDHRGGQASITVVITVLETPQDLLMASSLQGGVPGSKNRMCPFMITNSVDIYGFQFTFRWDHAKLAVDSIRRAPAIQSLSMYTNLGDSAGKATVLVFGLAGQKIPAGLDTVVYPAFRVYENAEPSEVDILLENATEAINPGYPSQPLGVTQGKFFIDRFGDVNLDQRVDVGDAVSLVHRILGYIAFTTRQELCADANRDTLINVGDLVAMIDMILGRWMGPSPPMYPGPMAVVKLDYGDLTPGSFGELQVMAELEVPVAGAQLEINYDPSEVSFQVPVLSERSDHCLIEYRDDGKGRLRLLLYNMSNEPIATGKGSIVSLPVTLGPYAEKSKIQLKQVVLADQKAALIPVGDHIYVPTGFELSQNYPNPFNPSTTIKFTLPSQQEGGLTLPTTLKIYNVLGEVVRTLVDEPMAPGAHEVVWDGKDDQGDETASGIYFYRLRAGDFQDTKKMVLMR